MKRVVVIVIMLILCGSIFADGGFFFRSDVADLEAEQAQKVVITYNTNTSRQRLYLSVAVSNSAPTNACWLIATPSLVAEENFKEMDDMSLYEELHRVSNPYLAFYEYSDYYDDYEYGYFPLWGCFCGGMSPSGDYKDSESEPSQVTIWYSITNTNYVLTALSADDPEVDILDWLTNEGYYVSEDYKEVLDFYVANGWYFIAIVFEKIGVETTLFARFEFETETPVFPLYISSINSAPVQAIQIMYLSQYRACTTNYTTTEMPVNKIKYLGSKKSYDSYFSHGNSGNWNYYEIMDNDSATSGYGKIFVEYAKDLNLYQFYNNDAIRELTFVEDPIWLTRFYLNVSAEKMKDIYFIPAPSNQRFSIYKYIEVDYGVTNVYTSEEQYNYHYAKRTIKNSVMNLAGASTEFGLILIPFGFMFIKRRIKKKK